MVNRNGKLLQGVFMKKFYYFLYILSAMAVGQAGAVTYLGSVEGIGDSFPAYTGRALGMGNTSIAASQGSEAVFYNPANMLKGKKSELSLTPGFYSLKETIVVEDDTTRYSSASYLKLNAAGAIPVAPGIRVGAGYAPVLDLNYKHEKKIYDSGTLDSIIEYSRTGGFDRYILALAVGLTPEVGIGVNYNIIKSGYETDSRLLEVDSTKLECESNGQFTGGSYDVGVIWKIVPEDVWPDTPDSSKEVTGNLKYEFPKSVGIGFVYKFWERERSLISVDLVKTFWEDFRYTETKDTTDADYNVKVNPVYRNTVRVSVGVEHYLNLRTVLRYGFTHQPHYSRTSADTTMFTVGLGFPLNESIDLDVAGAYGKRNFYGDNVFFDEEEMVDERIATILATAGYRF
jgi:hypothetical protein